jgi:hypothetical protein
MTFEHAIHSFLMIVQKSAKTKFMVQRSKELLWQVFFTNKIGN